MSQDMPAPMLEIFSRDERIALMAAAFLSLAKCPDPVLERAVARISGQDDLMLIVLRDKPSKDQPP